jgi:hypothetical protein
MAMSRKIWVPMPESDMYKKTMSRDQLVQRYGEATISRAELAVILNILFVSGVIKPNEFYDAMIQQCERIESVRRAVAGLESDRG